MTTLTQQQIKHLSEQQHRSPGDRAGCVVDRNWPAKSVGNRPTPAKLQWTWASLTLVFFGIGAVLYHATFDPRRY